MALDRIRFVDGISATPTVRLDLNDEVSWAVSDFDAPPPGLRYSESSSMLRDGAYISASAYENRTITLTAELIVANQDTLGTELQKLARIIDSDRAILEYRRVGATSSVFFRTLRADVSQIEQLIGPAAANNFTLRIPAEPFAIGNRVDAVAAATLAINPAAGANGLFINVPTVQGDVATEPLIWVDPINGFDDITSWLAAEPAPPGGIYFVQAEAGVVSTDTTTQANDATMSGAGNNFTRTTFATNANLARRLNTLSLPAGTPPGDYRILVRARQAAAGSNVYTLRIASPTGNPVNGETVTLTNPGTAPKLYDLGIMPLPVGGPPVNIGFRPEALGGGTPVLAIDAGRTSGAQALDLDYVVAVPARWRLGLVGPYNASSTGAAVIDGPNDVAYQIDGASPISGTSAFVPGSRAPLTGSLPLLFPGVTSRIHILPTDGAIGTTHTVSVSYWSKYLYVRPAST